MHIDIKPIATFLRRSALAVVLAATSSMASAGIIHVAIDSGNFGVASGYLDLQLSTGDGPLTTALVSNMVGFDPAAFIDAVGVTRTAGGYLFRNDTFTDLFHAVNFGGVLSFDLSFASGIDPSGLHASHFIVSAYDEAFSLLGKVDPRSGSLADFGWTPAATAGIDGNISASISDAAVSFIPEPSGLPLSAIGLAAIALVMRRRVR
ncbi:MAG: NF038129 family PEP-CTERM protein, partial [Massilia sp.]